jgi:acetyl-CoA synthetase
MQNSAESMTDLDRFLAARELLLRHRTDYESAVRTFSWPQLNDFNWARDWFDTQATGNTATALWIVDEQGHEEKRSFARLAADSNRVANFFRRKGFQPGDVVFLMLGNVVPLWETLLAAIKLGLVVIPATNLLTAEDIADRLARGQVRHIVASAADLSKFEGLGEGLTRLAVGGVEEGWTAFAEAYSESDAPGDTFRNAAAPLLRYFTSGTTSKPKLVEHSQASYPVGHLSTMYWLGLQPGDVHWNISSPGWAKHAWSCVFAPWNAGATVFIFNQARFEARRTLTVLSHYPVTTLCAPPTVWRMLIQEPLAQLKHSLRELISAGEPLNPEVIEQVQRAWQLTIRDGYGQTETTAQLGNSPGQRVKPGSVGRPLPGYALDLLDAGGKSATHGEISIRLGSPLGAPLALMSGYAGDAEKTRKALGGTHYGTGDVAERDAEGYFTFIGRADDVFKASDYRISPFELESLLIEHADVAEAAVVPSPDPERLAVAKAFIVLRSGVHPSREVALSILQFARERLAAYKRVRRIEFSDLPKTISGKIRRVELRQAEQGRDLSGRNVNEYWEQDFPELKR